MSAGFKKIKRLKKAGKSELCDRLIFRRLLKSVNHLNGKIGTPLDNSIQDAFRTRYRDEYGDSFTEYGLIADTFKEEEGEALDRALYEIYGREIHSVYDCTGLTFTRYIHGHRNPNGMISVIHGLGRDV